ncbi:hypothetical protein DFS34DRAFT_614828 [Phlyctochytrium arcticum]|nr:hypothetical protein DFS34DRAFT_614828 [Phlyctochytrium arcticum]
MSMGKGFGDLMAEAENTTSVLERKRREIAQRKAMEEAQERRRQEQLEARRLEILAASRESIKASTRESGGSRAHGSVARKGDVSRSVEKGHERSRPAGSSSGSSSNSRTAVNGKTEGGSLKASDKTSKGSKTDAGGAKKKPAGYRSDFMSLMKEAEEITKNPEAAIQKVAKLTTSTSADRARPSSGKRPTSADLQNRASSDRSRTSAERTQTEKSRQSATSTSLRAKGTSDRATGKTRPISDSRSSISSATKVDLGHRDRTSSSSPIPPRSGSSKPTTNPSSSRHAISRDSASDRAKRLTSVSSPSISTRVSTSSSLQLPSAKRSTQSLSVTSDRREIRRVSGESDLKRKRELDELRSQGIDRNSNSLKRPRPTASSSTDYRRVDKRETLPLRDERTAVKPMTSAKRKGNNVDEDIEALHSGKASVSDLIWGIFGRKKPRYVDNDDDTDDMEADTASIRREEARRSEFCSFLFSKRHCGNPFGCSCSARIARKEDEEMERIEAELERKKMAARKA